jgi:hypothetical protein
MPAPLGNQYAAGCETSGRPRTVTPKEEELIVLGKEMVKWVEENNPLHISAWYSIKKGILEKHWKQYIEKEEFKGYYERAMRIIGQKYLDKESNVREGVSQRWQRVYFKDLKEEEDETFKMKIREELKAKQEFSINNQVSPNESKLDIEDQLLKIQTENAAQKAENAALKEKLKANGIQ